MHAFELGVRYILVDLVIEHLDKYYMALLIVLQIELLYTNCMEIASSSIR